KEMFVGATGKTDLQRFPRRGMRSVTTGKVGRRTLVYHSVRPFEARDDAIRCDLKIQQFRSAFHFHAGFTQTTEKEKFVFVLGKNQRIRVGAEAGAQIAEHGSRRSPSCNPKISGNRLTSALHHRISEPDLAIKFECPRLYGQRT